MNILLLFLMAQRVFYSLLERIGGSGRYQTITLNVWAATMMVMGSTNFFLPYVFYQGNYQCPEGVTNCKDYVCSLAPDQRGQFVHDDLYSLASKFGDYRCDNNVDLDLLQSFIYLGGVIGVIIGAFINQIITKRILLIATVVANIFGLVTALLGNNLLVSSIGLFINYAATGIQFQIIQCYIIETVSQEVRGEHMTMNFISFGLGVTLNGLFFYLLKNAITYIIILVPILLVVLSILVLYIEETPFDLIINSTPEKSLTVLEKIALANGKENEHKITLPEIENVKREFQQNEQKKQHSNISILDLFKFKSLRVMTIASLILHYVISFQFTAPEIAIRNFSLSIYINGVVIGFAQLGASIVTYFTIDHYQRKKTIYITQALCLLTSLPIYIFLSCNNGGCSMTSQVLQTIGLTIFRLAATTSYNFFYMMQYQTFPNQIRGLALQVVCMPSYLSNVTLPQIITFCEKTGISIVFTFTVCTIIVGTMMTCLPQTFGIPPPEIIEELKYEHHELVGPDMHEKIKEN